jgi:hypothetical protein
MVSLTIAYVSMDFNEREYGELLHVILLYRALNKLYHCPLTAGIESISLVYLNSIVYLLLVSFFLDRLLILYRKSTYVLVSVVTAIKNKKQRFSNQGLCFVLEFTLLLPVTLSVLLITTLLDTATIPFLGFAFFTIGYPKPKRGWSEINPTEANPNDERSDGHLY